MFMFRLVAAASLGVAVAANASDAPDLGEAVDDATLVNADFVVMPDGEGLPGGSGSAVEGAAVYATYCVACHGENGTDGVNDKLAGGHGSLTSTQPQRTVGSYWPYATTLFDYIRRAMPYQAPGSLSNDDVYALTAYVLHLNEIIGEAEQMNARTLPSVSMPNRDNFIWDFQP